MVTSVAARCFRSIAIDQRRTREKERIDNEEDKNKERNKERRQRTPSSDDSRPLSGCSLALVDLFGAFVPTTSSDITGLHVLDKVEETNKRWHRVLIECCR
jgi:hypothetical protein